MKYIFLIVFILSCSFSCTHEKEDHSLSVDAYRKLGMPDPGKRWNMADYTQANNVLAKVKWERPLQLPVKDSQNSGLLFEHLVSLEHLAFMQDNSLSLNEKAERISEFIKVYDYWMDIYTNPTLKRNYFHREIIDIQLFNLGLTEAMLNLAHEINRSTDPADIALQYGYGAIKGNYLACLNNDLKTQSYTSDFLAQDLERMADSIYNSVMRNKEWMDSSAVSELKYSLRLVMDSTSSDHIRNK
ncbi:MAG TPA: hypothetical protein VIQ51_16145, partial [Chryseosolibacter sp.]